MNMKSFLLTFVALAISVATASPVTEEHALGKRALAEVITKCSRPNTVALTFDDGPYIWHERVSRTLRDNGAKGTFFINGNNFDCVYDPNFADQLLQSFMDGNQIASHTWSHPHLTQISSSQLRSELSRIDTAMKKILGVKSAFLRPPYGEYNDAVRDAVGNNGQKVLLWDFDSGDSTGSTAEQSKQAYNELFASKPNNILALNHETVNSTVFDVLPYVLNTFKNSGYDFVTVAECLGMEPYISQTAPGTRDASWTCN